LGFGSPGVGKTRDSDWNRGFFYIKGINGDLPYRTFPVLGKPFPIGEYAKMPKAFARAVTVKVTFRH
jgi:hypothetical protein